MAAERVVCVDVDGGEQEQQQQEKELQLSDLPNDALQSILLRLPSPPRYLAVAAAVARNWRRQILGNSGGDGSFLRAFRGAHGGVPPLLGFFCNRQGFSCPFFTSTAAGGVAGMSPPAGTGKRRPFVHDARHGRVLLDDGEDGQLLVWDPLTRSQDVIPTPRCYFTSNDSCGASLICGCEVHAGAGDDDCHWAAFHVVVAFTDLPCFCPDEWNLDRICVRVWSSATKEWSEVYSMRGTCDFDFMPSAFVAGAVHWLVGESSAVLQFNLNTKQLALIRTPVDLSEFMLFPTKDGKLGFTGVLGSHIIFFHMDISGDALVGERVWSIQNVISIDHFFPSNVNVLATCGLADDSEEDDDDDDDDDTISDDDDDDDDDDENRGIQRTMRHDNEASGSQCLGSSDPLSHEDFDKENNSLISMISPNVDVIGFIAEANAVLLHAAGRGVYTIDVETKRTRRVAASANYSHVFPYTSFYTSAGKTVFGEPTFPDRKNKGTSGSGSSIEINWYHAFEMFLDLLFCPDLVHPPTGGRTDASGDAGQ
uniref:F-box domain-containing protein n=1 Tax=Oryza brachyantha TaxID=4533 RepID=J3N0U0_ORYBR